jgi:hypothetical protein
MKTTRKCSRQQIVNRNIIISILLAAVLGIFNSARAQDADEAEMEIEDWMIDPAYWQNVSKEIEKKY